MPPLGGTGRRGSGGIEIVLRPPLQFIQRQTGAFRQELRNLEPLWDRFAPILTDIFARQFETRGGGEWPALAESTLRQKAAKGYPADPMVATGDLRSSLTDPGRAMDSSRFHMSWGTDKDFAHWHQEGGSIPGRPPVRQLIPDPFRTEDRRRLEKEMIGWIDDAAAKTFGRI